jgi:ABC-type Zn uptake system ZnuABC Zn-binding protein ZnuA
MSPLNVMEWAERIAHALAEEDPANAAYYEKRADDYKGELEKLDRKIREALAPIPEERRIIVTDHDLFRYFTRDYHVKVVGTIIPSFSTNAEPSAKDMAELLAVLEEKGVNALFVGETSGEAVLKLARSLETESGGEAEVVEFLAGSLGKKGDEGDSYISFMEYNLEQIVYGLQL